MIRVRILTLLAAALLSSATPTRAQYVGRQWSVYMYLAGDNNLSEHLVMDADEVLRGLEGLARPVGVVAQIDRNSTFSAFDPPAAHHSVTRRYFLDDPKTRTLDREYAVGPDSGHDDASDPSELRKFLNWARDKRPAAHTAVLVGAHGEGPRAADEPPMHSRGPAADSPGVRSLLFDEFSGRWMTVVDFARALEGEFKGSRIDVIGLDACLMATVELAYELRNVAGLLVASEREELGIGWDHSVWSRQVSSSPEQWLSAEYLSSEFLSSFGRAVRAVRGRNYTYTLAVLDLARVEAFTEALIALVRSIVVDWNSLETRCSVFCARADCQDLGGAFQSNTVDVGCWLQKLRGLRPESARAATEATMSLLGGQQMRALIAKADIGSSLGMHTGLGIYFPRDLATSKVGLTPAHYEGSDLARQLSFVRDHKEWLQFIQSYLAAALEETCRCR